MRRIAKQSVSSLDSKMARTLCVRGGGVSFKTCIRKSVFDKIGLFDEKLLVAEDYDITSKIKNQISKIRPFYARHSGPVLAIATTGGLRDGGKFLNFNLCILLFDVMTPDSLSANSTIQIHPSEFQGYVEQTYGERPYGEWKAKCHFEVFKRFADTFTSGYSIPDTRYSSSIEHRDLSAVRVAESRIENQSDSPACAKIAFDQACSDMRDCLELEPNNRLFQQLWRDCFASLTMTKGNF